MRCPLLFCLAVLAGCGGSDIWSPIGTYQIIQVWQNGTCSVVNPRLWNLSIRSAGSDVPLQIKIDSPAEVENILLNEEECLINIEMIEPPGSGLPFQGTAVTMYNIVEVDGNLEGSGVMTVGSPDNCSQNFTIDGSKQ